MLANLAIVASSVALWAECPSARPRRHGDRMTDRLKTSTNLAQSSGWRQINGPLFPQVRGTASRGRLRCTPDQCPLEAGLRIKSTKLRSFAFNESRRRRQPSRSGSSSRRSKARSAGRPSCLGRPAPPISGSSMGCACCAKYLRSRNWRSLIRPARSSSAYPGWRWTSSTARSIFPKSRNSPTRWPRRSITVRDSVESARAGIGDTIASSRAPYHTLCAENHSNVGCASFSPVKSEIS